MNNQRTPFFTPRIAFLAAFLVCLLFGGLVGLTSPARAEQPAQLPGYGNSAVCGDCHKDIYEHWEGTLHAHAFSSPIFQRDWSELGASTQCLACHTTGFDPATGKYGEEGVTCEACHGPMSSQHPKEPMPIKADAELCATCHKTTTDEWRASPHSPQIDCDDCHDQHGQKPKAETVTQLCTNCHKDNSESFTHGSHANAGLECSNCHMYSAPRTGSPIGGLVPTGHTFAVGSETCIGCHQDTVHSRNEIVKLTGEIAKVDTTDITAMEKELEIRNSEISTLKQQSDVRLYTGLMQGAIIGLMTGAVAAWIVSKRIRLVEAENE